MTKEEIYQRIVNENDISFELTAMIAMEEWAKLFAQFLLNGIDKTKSVDEAYSLFIKR